MTLAPSRTLTAALAAAALSTGLTVLGPIAPAATADDIRACDPGGTTTQDVTIGQQLNAQLDSDMRGNMDAYETSCARVVVQTVKARGLSSRAAAIAIATVIVESHLRNVNYGDRDSLGLYQQRDGWGTAAQRLHPPTATHSFLDVMQQFYPNGSWAAEPIGEVAADVQRPAAEYRYRYGVQAADAQLIVAALWDAAPGTSTTLPGLSTISRVNGGLDVFATTSDGHLKHRNMSAGVWGCWATLPYNAKIKGDPAAIYTDGRIDVFAQGIDNRLKKITWVSGYGWYPWADMGEYVVTSSPAVTSRHATGVDVFAKNGENKIVYRHYDTVQGWTTNWSNIGLNASTVTASGAPAAVANADGSRMNVFARAADGSLLSLMWTRDAGWYSWADRGGNFTGRPTASTRGGDSVDIFLRDHDNSFIHRYSPNGADWTTYPASDFGGYLLTSPTAVAMSGQRIDVFSRNSNADLIRKTWTSANGWYEWAGHGAVGAPAC
ncbi:hypothetical protein LZG04_38805 [Saccharothrix sp. S26]|uniref:hypothetical protein n=1 Tax=Saccharothrix sp. S26 TaxID=2907215 RepID=UPI001F2AE36B|nr:hypothetical protein [Saccharothrix sp. S26]MCE7000724.1 hypothetical protein [Saccharothrix sp. S26]